MNKLIPTINIVNNNFNKIKKLYNCIHFVFKLISKQLYIKNIPNGKISLLLTSDDQIKKLNLKFRGKDKSTNILSFPFKPDKYSILFNNFKDLPYLGDIIIAYETLNHEAKVQEKSIKNHFIHLLIHSVLHILGYNHIKNNEALEMENLEINILTTINIKNPYI